MLRWLLKFFTASLFILAISLPSIGLLSFTGAYLSMAPSLPSTQELAAAKLQMPMHIYSMDGKLMGTYGSKHRQTITYAETPERFIKAILAAEDSRFFEHKGVDIKSLLRAIYSYADKDTQTSGGSTITMQLAKLLYLTHDKTVLRKLKQIFLAWNIEQQHSKQDIFELYLNKIYLGKRAHGVATAAQTYYGKPLEDLNLAQYAMIAALPKAPSVNNPISNPEAAITRRNWILQRMYKLNYIDYLEYLNAKDQPVSAKLHKNEQHNIHASLAYPAEMARQEAYKRFGEALYTDGYTIYTSIDSELQKHAHTAVINGITKYDKRHGYRGAETNIENPAHWQATLDRTSIVNNLHPAIVTSLNSKSIGIKLKDGTSDTLQWNQGLSTARRYINPDKISRAPQRSSDLFKTGDLIRIKQKNNRWHLAQIPKAQAALVAMAPQNGHILAMLGGFDYETSKFNRAAQAKRQSGSTLKPLIYAAAMELKGFTAASVINDKPRIFKTARGDWKPTNSSGKFYGPTLLRKALYYSRNLVTISLLESIGVRDFTSYLGRFGFKASQLPSGLSLALGSNSMTPLEVTNNFSDIANGGYHVSPTLVTRIDKHDKTVFYANPALSCFTCENHFLQKQTFSQRSFNLAENHTTLLEHISQPVSRQAPRVMDERVNYIINDILQDVIQKGTAKKALVLERSDIAGKTGTTNGPLDAWFAGYHQDIAVTTWLGFDRNEKLGKNEFGGSAALPIWIDFMRNALKDVPEKQIPEPLGISRLNIHPSTGKVLLKKTSHSLVEIFRTEYVSYPEESIVAEEPENEFSDVQEVQIDIPIYDTQEEKFIDTTIEDKNYQQENNLQSNATREQQIADTISNTDKVKSSNKPRKPAALKESKGSSLNSTLKEFAPQENKSINTEKLTELPRPEYVD